MRALRRPEPQHDLARVGVASVPDLLRYYRGKLEGIVARRGPGPINTDDNGWLEHRAPLDLMRMTTPGEALSWDENVAGDLAEAFAKNPDEGAKVLLEALDAAINADDRSAARGFWMTLRKMGRPETAEAEAKLAGLAQRGDQSRQAAELLSQAQSFLVRAAQEADGASGGRAVEILTRAAQLDPRNGEIAWKLGTALITVRDPEAAAIQLRKALAMLPLGQQFPVRRDLVIAETLVLRGRHRVAAAVRGDLHRHAVCRHSSRPRLSRLLRSQRSP